MVEVEGLGSTIDLTSNTFFLFLFFEKKKKEEEEGKKGTSRYTISGISYRKI
jgi:hypothetical protein